MKIAIERGDWKAQRVTIAMDSTYTFHRYSGLGRESVGLKGWTFLRLCMDAPQVRLAGIGFLRFPAVDVAFRIALAMIWAALHGWKSPVTDFLFHMVNFSLNGWTYGLICEAATLPVFHGQGVAFAGRILVWIILMRGIDALLSAFMPDRRELRSGSQRTERLKSSFEAEKPLSHTPHTALQQSLRPVAGFLCAYLLAKPVFGFFTRYGFQVIVPTPAYLVSVATAMAWCFLYRLISYSVHRQDSIEMLGIPHLKGDKRPDKGEARAMWVRSILLPDRDPASWIFWAPVWIGLYVAASCLGSSVSPKQALFEFLPAAASVPLLCPLWVVLMEWADGDCAAYHDLEPRRRVR